MSPGIGVSLRIDLIPVPVAVLPASSDGGLEARQAGKRIRDARVRLRLTVAQACAACGGWPKDLSWRQVEAGTAVIPAGPDEVIRLLESAPQKA